MFTFCVQNMQANYMGYLLQPIMHTLNSLQSISLGTITSILVRMSNLEGKICPFAFIFFD